MLLAAMALLIWPRPLIELYTSDAQVLAVGPGCWRLWRRLKCSTESRR